MRMAGRFASAVAIAVLSIATASVASAATVATDLVVYGCTPAGITAAIEARRLKRSVTLICRDAYVGGMTTNGLGWADTGNHGAIGGLARQFYRDVKAYYAGHNLEIVASTPAAFGTFFRAEKDRWARVVAETGAKID